MYIIINRRKKTIEGITSFYVSKYTYYKDKETRSDGRRASGEKRKDKQIPEKRSASSVGRF